jgi:hypothetical protein
MDKEDAKPGAHARQSGHCDALPGVFASSLRSAPSFLIQKDPRFIPEKTL